VAVNVSKSEVIVYKLNFCSSQVFLCHYLTENDAYFIISSAEEDMFSLLWVCLFVSLFVCLFVCVQDYKYKYKWEFVECGLQIVQGR